MFNLSDMTLVSVIPTLVHQNLQSLIYKGVHSYQTILQSAHSVVMHEVAEAQDKKMLTQVVLLNAPCLRPPWGSVKVSRLIHLAIEAMSSQTC